MSSAINQFDGEATTSGSDKEQGYETHAQPSRAEIFRAFNLLWPERDRVELRIIHNKPNAMGKKPIDSGLFDREHIPALIDTALKSNSLGAVYVNINPIKKSYVPPSLNELKRGAVGLVGNSDIECRKYLPIDLDPIRPTNTSATSAQLENAKETAIQIQQYLNSKGWPEPVVCESGNGIHLLYRIDLPNDQGSEILIEGFLGGLGSKFNNQFIKIDKVMKNAGRIIKLYGTVSNKGDNTVETPHRLSRMLSVPASIQPVTVEQLQQEVSRPQSNESPLILGLKPEWLNSTDTHAWEISGVPFDLDQFLKRLSIGFKKQIKKDGCEWFHLNHCPFNVSHGAGDSAISRQTNGKLGFKCFHDSCADKNWHSLRALVQASIQHEPETANCGSPQKLPPALRPVPALNENFLPDALRDAVIDLADRLQCPPDYLAVAMLSAAGAVVGNKVGIFPYANDESWEVYPALWGGVVGDPGSKKTPSLQHAHRPLQDLENMASQKYAQDMHTYKQSIIQHDKALSTWKNSKSISPMPTPPVEPKRERYVVHDSTYQALGVILADNPRGILALADELSALLQSLDTAGQEAARGFYLTGWSGTGGYSFDRIGRGSITLNRYCLSVFGGFQPDRVKAYVQFSQRGSTKNDGLLQRFQLLVWPDPMCNFQLVDRPPNKTAIDKYHQAMLALPKLTEQPFPSATRLPNDSQLLHFTATAQQVFNSWYVQNEKMITSGGLDSARQSHFAKYRSLIPALALLFHLLEAHTGPVCEDCLYRAISFAKYLKKHADRIYASVTGQDHAAIRGLAERLLKGQLQDGFTCRTVHQKGWAGLSTKEQAHNAIEALVEYNWLVETDSRSAGRPTVKYTLNPNVTADLL
jgi:hypothetical protein